MQKDDDKWMEDIFHSMKGSKRARPRKGLFDQIERGLNQQETKIKKLIPWRNVAAAAILLLCLNSIALIQARHADPPINSSSQVETALISSYKIYE